MQTEARPIALVTGASSGIGREFARRLARDGADLVLIARRRERLEEVARKLEAAGRRAEVLVADLSTHEGLAAAEQRAGAGDVTMLINNAGFQNYMPFLELAPDRAEAQVMAQLTAVLRLCRAALPGMVQRGSGAIINVSSALAFSAGMAEPQLPKRATYAATKAFVNAFTEILAGEVAGSGVRVQVLCPGVVRTEFHNVDGVPRLRPNVPVLEPEQVVEASLKALALGDIVCLPALADRTLVEREREARHAVFHGNMRDQLAERYRGDSEA